MKFKKMKLQNPKPVVIHNKQLVSYEKLGLSDLPLVIKPNIENIDLLNWLVDNKKWVEEKLLKYGGVLFRGFSVNNIDYFDSIVDLLISEPMKYTEGATPRTKLNTKIYTSTEFPAQETIALHNELSYVNTWPGKIIFFCLKKAEEGGETPIANVHRILKQIPEEIVNKFREKKWMLVRNYGDGFGLPWQRVFGTERKEDVEEYCKRNQIGFEWKDGDRLRTYQVRPAIATHPVTGQELWFNHIAFWHESSLKENLRNSLLKEFGRDGLPFNTYYGDGSEISYEDMEKIRLAYDLETITFPWEEGDVLVLDNMLVAHGRNPFKGERKVVVSMGECISRKP